MIKKIAFLLVLILLAVLPFNAFLSTYIQFGLGINVPVNIWKEVVVVILTVLAFIEWIQKKKKIVFDVLDWGIIAFFILATISAIFQTQHLGKIIFGFKYDVEFFWLFFVVRHGFIWHKSDIRKMIITVAITASIILIFGILQATVLPKNIMTLFGYAPIVGSWIPEGPLPMYHAAGTDASLLRISSTLSGPNQLAMYSLIILFIAVIMVWKGEKKEVWWWRILGLLSCIGLFFTYSRSAQLGALIGAIIFLAMMVPHKKTFWKWFSVIAVSFLLVGIVVNLLKPDFIHQVIIRASSSQGHYERSLDGVLYSLQNPWGHGIGNAGPASARFNEDRIGWIPENWYLQISLEMGLIGLGIFIFILYQSFLVLKWNTLFYSKALLLTLVALSIASFFLHAWEESAVCLTYWLLFGVVSSSKNTT